ERHFSVMSHMIIGVVVATTLPILPANFSSASDAVVRLSLLALGFAVASVFEMINSRLKQ
nr:hypothetical protein [Clostridia bacterium]